MNCFISRMTALLSLAATSACIATLFTPSAQAGTLHQGWNYAVDSPEDSLGIGQVGGTKFELYSMALKQTEERVFVALNSNMPWNGVYEAGAADRHVGYSDLLFNFTGENLSSANANSSLIGVRFSDNNDSGAPKLGVYSNVKAHDQALANDNPQGSLQGYINSVNKYGKTASIGDLAVNNPYFDLNQHIPTLMTSVPLENWMGDIEVLTDFSGLGLDSNYLGSSGQYTYGFSFARDLLPEGDFIAHLSLDCNNDHIALMGTMEEQESVPEPTTAFALGAVGLLVGVSRKRRQKDDVN
ncbi:PEP-CTERM sorting domain-containing protein [Spirulina sp. CS-785/01]|uniref:PEP-CTERM sorting domain-containing protein n=1 Tax=Spirulina sp. CS-785/01 TaxID=3021716 RepID=UPI00232E8A2B|nr:PEP-CTERM sorting domain-containing protein [Spirulina sp. CS-785/01]MDB9312559.1 PEP-CTERM sorting domain-containing protein [Spirulina sp. CS-785/01]